MARAEAIEAMVLAAGASSRLGSPKALLAFGARPALQLVLDAIREAGIRRGVVVVGDDAAALAAAVDPAPLAWAQNPVPETGRMGSVLVGLRAMTSGADVLLWPVDRPLASARTVAALMAERERAAPDEGVMVPEHDGARGHPVILRAALLPSLAAASPGANLREVIRASGTRRRAVAVDDPGILFDLDTVRDYERALAWWREGTASGRE
jgi:molybdenum cofactor cytidylyltransferase